MQLSLVVPSGLSQSTGAVILPATSACNSWPEIQGGCVASSFFQLLAFDFFDTDSEKIQRRIYKWHAAYIRLRHTVLTRSSDLAEHVAPKHSSLSHMNQRCWMCRFWTSAWKDFFSTAIWSASFSCSSAACKVTALPGTRPQSKASSKSHQSPTSLPGSDILSAAITRTTWHVSRRKQKCLHNICIQELLHASGAHLCAVNMLVRPLC